MNRKSPSIYVRIKMNYFRLILKGIKILESREDKFKHNFNKQFDFIIKNKDRKSLDSFADKILNNPFQKEFKTQIYNKYKIWLTAIGICYLFFYIKHNYTQPEFEIRNKPNFLIPASVYKVRREHYIYWELSRIARGRKKTFSYFNYDKEAKLLYFIDKKGKNIIEKIIFNEERPDLLENPFLEFLMKQKPWTEEQLEKANKISAYYMSLNNYNDLDNYLHYKSLNVMDFARWIYYYIMIYTKIADTYRYEQFLKKPDFIYDFEMLMHSVNFNSNDKERVKENLIFVMQHYFILLFSNKIAKLIKERPKKFFFTDEELEEIIINNWEFDPNDPDIDEEDETENSI